ncbi:MAG: nucleoside phosphorylase [Angelakisella sp.]
MLEKRGFPILEFDNNMRAKIEPFNVIQKQDVPPYCVITFFAEVIKEMLDDSKLKQIGCLKSETVTFPIYETVCNNKRIAIVQGFVGAAGSAGLIEELTAMGFTHFIVCGGAGVLQRNIQVGHLIVPVSAVRDEGVSYHYIEPSREVECNQHAIEVIEKQLELDNIPYIKSKTWTTDALYRETEDKIALRVSEGCVTVEMEAAAFFAVAKFRNVILGQILYGGDDLSGVEWDNRTWNSRGEIKKNLVELSLKICVQL